MAVRHSAAICEELSLHAGTKRTKLRGFNWVRKLDTSCGKDRQVSQQKDRQQSHGTNTAEVNAITETSSYFVAFHHHHLSRSPVLSPSFMAGFLIDDKVIYVFPSLPPPTFLAPPIPCGFSLYPLCYLCFLCFISLFSLMHFLPSLILNLHLFFAVFLSSAALLRLTSLLFLLLSPRLHRSPSSSPLHLLHHISSKHLGPSPPPVYFSYVVPFFCALDSLH